MLTKQESEKASNRGKEKRIISDRRMSTVESEIDRYAGLYRTGKTGWHRNEVNSSLIRHAHLLPQNLAGSPPKWICVPLCGKSRDVPYLLSLGYRVFGIEAVKEAILELGTENDLCLEYNEVDGVYKTPDGNLIIFQGDIFQCPIEKWAPFHGVWDRGSFSIFPDSLRPDYIKVIQRGLSQADFRYLLEVYNYDKTLSIMPPRAAAEDDIQDLFGSWAKINILQSSPVSQKFLEHHSHLEQVQCNQVSYLINEL